MFEFTKNVADNLVKSLEQTRKSMETEAQNYETKATEYESLATDKENEASSKESEASSIDLNPQKEVKDYTTDEEGNSVPNGSHWETDEATKAQNITT